MSKDDETNPDTPTALLTIKDAANILRDAFKKYANGEIDDEELSRIAVSCIPMPDDVGMTKIRGEECVEINTKPVPENPDSVVYFYEDENGVSQMTVRFPRREDNARSYKGQKSTGSEMLGMEVLRLIIREHKHVFQSEMMRVEMAKMLGVDPNDANVEDLLSRMLEEEGESNDEGFDEDLYRNLDPELAKKLKNTRH